eukprot:15455538-Alexandrium_andersonii.AAC.1
MIARGHATAMFPSHEKGTRPRSGVAVAVKPPLSLAPLLPRAYESWKARAAGKARLCLATVGAHVRA